MASFDVLYEEVARHIPRCPSFIMEKAVRASVIDFCEQSEIWIEQLDDIYLYQGSSTYDVDIDPQSRIFRILSAGINGQLLSPVSDYSLQTSEDESQPNTFAYLPSNEIALYPSPDNDYVLSIKSVMTPSFFSKEAPEYILLGWSEAIVSGAVSRLFFSKGYDWYSPEEGRLFREMFNNAVLEERINKNKARSGVGSRVKARRFV